MGCCIRWWLGRNYPVGGSAHWKEQGNIISGKVIISDERRASSPGWAGCYCPLSRDGDAQFVYDYDIF